MGYPEEIVNGRNSKIKQTQFVSLYIIHKLHALFILTQIYQLDMTRYQYTNFRADNLIPNY